MEIIIKNKNNWKEKEVGKLEKESYKYDKRPNEMFVGDKRIKVFVPQSYGGKKNEK